MNNSKLWSGMKRILVAVGDSVDPAILRVQQWSKVKKLAAMVAAFFCIILLVGLLSAGVGALTSGVSLPRLADSAKVEGDTVKMTLDCDNWGQEMLVLKICATIVDLAHNHPECKKYELLLQVSGVNSYGKTVISECKFSGDDLEEVRKYENGGYYASVSGGWIASQLRNAHINMAQ